MQRLETFQDSPISAFPNWLDGQCAGGCWELALRPVPFLIETSVWRGVPARKRGLDGAWNIAEGWTTKIEFYIFQDRQTWPFNPNWPIICGTNGTM